MHESQDGTDRGVAPTPNPEKRAEVKRLAEASAFDTGRDCEHCDGSGRVYPGRRIIHSISPSGFGADWNVEDLLVAIDTAEYVKWLPAPGHALAVAIDGKPYRFAVPAPEVVE